jgi:hypothetical protein
MRSVVNRGAASGRRARSEGVEAATGLCVSQGRLTMYDRSPFLRSPPLAACFSFCHNCLKQFTPSIPKYLSL